MQPQLKSLVSAAIGCGLLAWALTPIAGQSSVTSAGVAAAQATATAQGEVLTVDLRGKMLAVRTATGEMSFRFTEETRVTGAQKSVGGLTTGAHVSVQYRKEGTDNHAVVIDVRAAQTSRP